MRIRLVAEVRVYTWFGDSRLASIEKRLNFEEIDGLPASRYLCVGCTCDARKEKGKVYVELLFAQPNDQTRGGVSQVLVDYQAVSITLDEFGGKRVSIDKVEVQIDPSFEEVAEVGRRIAAHGFLTVTPPSEDI